MTAASPSTFSMLLKRHRLAAGLTQEGLAERAGVSARGVQDLERGVHAPRAETARLLAAALQLDAEARAALIAAGFPPPTSDAAAAMFQALPAPPTPLVNREQESAAAVALLRRSAAPEGARLVTLTGPGGVGKTRVALAVAAEVREAFPDGVAWVDLAPLRDADLVAATVARALRVREDGARPLADTLGQFVANRRLLLVLDNMEQVLGAVGLVAALLAAAPHLAILATSRTRLRLRGERELPIHPLGVPAPGSGAPPLERLEEFAAVRLFVARAEDVRPGFALTHESALATIEICRRLDGLPLALELAAARVKLLPPSALLTRLTPRLPFLVGGPLDAPARQQTMRQAIDWSYTLLSTAEQSIFRRLAVFSGGFTLEAAEQIGGRAPEAGGTVGHTTADVGPPASDSVLDLLTSLVDQSLLRVSERQSHGEAPEPRFSLLETVHEYAWDQLLASGEAGAARRAHAEHCVTLAENALDRIHGPEGPAALNDLETEHDNLRAALAWAIESGEAATALRLAHASWRFWWMRSHLGEGRRWLERVLELPKPDDDVSPLRHQVMVAAGYFARVQGDNTDAVTQGERALGLARESGDQRGAAGAYHLLGLAAMDRGDWEVARRHLHAALDLDRGLAYRHGEAFHLSNLGDVALAQGELADAAAFGEAALAIWRERGDGWSVTWALIQLARVAHMSGDARRAAALLGESLAANERHGDKELTARAASELAMLADERGLLELAARLFGIATGLREVIGAPVPPAERARHEAAAAATRAGLDAAAFNRAWAPGRALAPDRALAEVLAAAEALT